MNKPRLKGLGRGLDALLAANQEDEAEKGELQMLPTIALQPGKYQPRTRMDPGSLEELAASIKAQGIMQPIMVRPVGDDAYEIIAGERRWRASQIAGLAEVPCLVRDIPDEAALAMSLIENIQREDLNPLEEASGIQRLIDEFEMTHQQAADAVGRSRPAASNLLRLLNLAKPVQELLMAGDIDMGHARALLPLDGASQIQLANQVAAKQLSVRDTERLVQQLLNPRQKKPAPQPDRDLLRLEEEISDAIGASVKIKANKKGAGEVSIRFGSLDQLDGLLGRLR
ncbi:chromosome partitioning protein ParB [Thauera propionica]|jgi:ParB family chromosome partitioning protein|uniref:Chromosome partitioning protein ParB n=2 Tax=Thauera TaxID=33057 RepID=A0A235F2T3_9RHOO|nr:ParB/RepB/Spo0J family partition protein [Thauera propionica]MDD3677063.1 ParB/RepB/Spo0J family partition protein [Thauera propionica]OYD55580.1 chromosome partitioning protein ParB [Thauera propionica]